jgi:catechol 2,3-dioxygenase-like lactoylglutathione lyase family enzyme
MLLNGVQHVAVLSSDTARLVEFYEAVFEATVGGQGVHNDEMSLTFIDIGPFNELNVFEFKGNDTATRPAPMFERGRLDHMGLRAASLEAFNTIRERLIERRSTDGFVTDFGPALSLFFVDPDGLEGEVLVENPNYEPGVFHPPGTSAAGYERVIDLGRD